VDITRPGAGMALPYPAAVQTLKVSTFDKLIELGLAAPTDRSPTTSHCLHGSIRAAPVTIRSPNQMPGDRQIAIFLPSSSRK